jgi:antitoxin component YwqK of YwqJK toxin-antitoxin module
MKEYWQGTRALKFTYELRRSANGKWERNGLSRAYYQNGRIEREGHYKDGKRVGKWTYYDEAGNVRAPEGGAE